MSLANPSKVLLLSRTTTPVAITAYAGNPLELTLVFSAGGTSNVFTGIDTLRLEIHADNLISPARVPLALLEWTSPTGAALTQTLTSAQLNLLGSSLDSKKFYLVVYAITGSSVEVYQMATLTLQSHPAALLADPPPAVGSAVALTLAQGNILYGADTGVTAGTYGSATLAPILTVNAKGKITAASTAAITASTAATLATARTLAITGDLAWTSPAFNGSANVTAAGTLASTGVTAGTYGSASVAPIITVDAKGRITSASTATIAASTAATLATARTINGVSFNGSANITVPVVPVVYDLYGTIDDTIASTATVARLTTALTANRIFTLPSPLNYPAGSPLTFVDATGTVGLTYNVTLYAGSNTVNGASSMVLSTPYASPVLISNGSNAWTLDVRGVSRGGTGATTAAGARTNLGAAGNQVAYVFEYASNNAGVSVTAGVSTFTPPAGWVSCTIEAIQGGAGGGSGARNSTVSNRCGGGGGAGGNRSIKTIFANSTAAGAWTITVGKGGDGGAAPTNDTTNGNPGSAGGGSGVQIGSTVLLAASINQSGNTIPNSGWGGGGLTSSTSGGVATGNGSQMFGGGAGGGSSPTANSTSSSATNLGGAGAPGGGSVKSDNVTIYLPGTGYGGAQTGGVANAAGGGFAPTGVATGYGTGGAGSGGGTNGFTGADGGAGTHGVVKLLFTF